MLEFINLFVAGILAGIEIAIHYGFFPLPPVLSDQSQIQLRQALVLRLRTLVPVFFVPTAVSGTMIAVFDAASPGVLFRCVGMLAILVWIGVRATGTVSINSATLRWEPGAPPRNWRAQVDRAERFHVFGVWASVLAFASFTTATALKLAAH